MLQPAQHLVLRAGGAPAPFLLQPQARHQLEGIAGSDQARVAFLVPGRGRIDVVSEQHARIVAPLARLGQRHLGIGAQTVSCAF